MIEQTFDVAGPVSAPAILLVHGSVVSRKMWLPQLRGLSDTYRVIIPDLPGHGALMHIPFTFAAAVDHLADLIHQEARGHALVTGLSLGGYVAIALANQHPDLVGGLVLSGCSHNFNGLLGIYLKAVVELMRRGWMKQSREQVERKTRKMFPPALADVAEAQMTAGLSPQSLGPAFSEMTGKDFASMLARYPGPGLILNGEGDAASRRGEATFVAAMRNGRAQAIPAAGHACSLDQPELYNRAIREFGRTTRARARANSVAYGDLRRTHCFDGFGEHQRNE